MTIKQAIRFAQKYLQNTSMTPRLDAEIILCHILDVPKSYLLAHTTDLLREEDHARFLEMNRKRANGIPIAYIVCEKEFFGRRFTVGQNVLIPRPETEMLIEYVLDFVTRKTCTKPCIVDIGTGSGCIAITLAKEILDSHIIATDISHSALHLARTNAKDLSAVIDFRFGDLFFALDPSKDGPFDIIVSNPPYVDIDTVDQQSPLQSSLQYEPREALTPPGLPCSLIIRLVTESPQWLSDSGLLIIEIGHDQGDISLHIAKKIYPTAAIQIIQDYSGLDRFLIVDQSK